MMLEIAFAKLFMYFYKISTCSFIRPFQCFVCFKAFLYLINYISFKYKKTYLKKFVGDLQICEAVLDFVT